MAWMGSEKQAPKGRGAGRMTARQVTRFIVILVVVYVSLMACWPVLGEGYSRLYRAGANFLFGSFGSDGVVEFNESNGGWFDTEVKLFNLGQADRNGVVKGVSIRHSSRRDGYMYVAYMMALIAATPISVRRKLRALLWGLLLMHCLIAVRLTSHLVDTFSKEPLHLFAISPFWKTKFDVFYQVCVVNVTFGFVAATFIWILVTFRREDWVKIISVRGRESGLAHTDLKRHTRTAGIGA